MRQSPKTHFLFLRYLVTAHVIMAAISKVYSWTASSGHHSLSTLLYKRLVCNWAQTLAMVRNGNHSSFFFCGRWYLRIPCVSKNMDAYSGRKSHDSAGTGKCSTTAMP